ncbi:MAG: DEAD/DEAH box helicase [Candidatus Gastranaerophilales bacterium]|nr:DEAD/DEAH box helicase [Candidatus Gastranaerophilales bacterium]
MDTNDKIFSLDFEFELDDFQKDAAKCIDDGQSVVVCAPTGAGKTVIAEYAIKKALNNNQRVFYTTPLKALSNQKFHDFQEAFGQDRVGLLTGDTSINRNAQVVVMTTEVFRNMLYGTNLGKIEENLKNVKYVVLDEVHYMNDEQRGTVWEESIIYCPGNIQLVALSATFSNSQELTDWINTVHNKTKLIYTDFRPVPLKHFYFSPSDSKKLLPLIAPGGGVNSKIQPEKKEKYGTKFKPKNDSESYVLNLINLLYQKEMLPAIYFAFSRKKCDTYAEKCSKLNLLSDFEAKRLMTTIDEYILENPYLANSKQLECLYSGIASHHAGLLPGLKGLIERLFQEGLIKVVFATETLAAGINMPARSTIISSISKRTDTGHRLLTANEFLQMSGRAGRRGMDEVGYVTVVGTSFQTPDEVAELVTSAANPLESKFTPSYSMVLNLLQRFTKDESRELILKSFGYYSSSSRLKPLYVEQKQYQTRIDEIENFKCHYKLKNEDILKFNKAKNQYVQMRKLTNTLRKQAKQSGRKNAEEVNEYEQRTKAFLKEMEQSKCNNCKFYKKHIKSIEILDRLKNKHLRISKVIEYEKDIYWQRFLNLSDVLEEFSYLKDDYPTEIGISTACMRTENEIFFSELINKGVLNNLSPSELAGILCAVITEESRNDKFISKLPLSGTTRKVLSDARDILRKIYYVQKKHNAEVPLLLNAKFSPYIEFWVNGGEWDDLVKNMDVAEGDIVRVFKRTVDLLRQLTVIPNVPEDIARTASFTIDCINRDPITEIF